MDGHGHVDLTLDAEHGLPELEVHGELGVGAGRRAGAAAPAGLRPAHPTEEGVEEVTEAARAERIARSRRPGTLSEDPGVAVPVVAGPPLGIAEHLVGEADLLEVLVVLGAGVVGVRVELAGLGPVGPLELLVGGVAADAEEFVEIVCP